MFLAIFHPYKCPFNKDIGIDHIFNPTILQKWDKKDPINNLLCVYS